MDEKVLLALIDKLVQQTNQIVLAHNSILEQNLERDKVHNEMHVKAMQDILFQISQLNKRVEVVEDRLHGSADRDVGLVSQVVSLEENVKKDNVGHKAVEKEFANIKIKIDRLSNQVKYIWSGIGFILASVTGIILSKISAFF